MSIPWISFVAERWGKSEINYGQMATEQDALSSNIISQITKPGYSNVKVLNPDGSCSIKCVYTTDYLQYQQSDGAWVLYKVLYLLFFAASVVLSVSVMQRAFALNYFGTGTLAILSHLFLIYFFCMMVCQIFAPRRMKLNQYAMGSKQMKACAFVYGLLSTLVLAVILCVVMANDAPPSPEGIFCITGQAMAAVLIFVIFGLEKKRSRIYVKNELPDNMEIIV